jgi:signal transduction histidine kinase
LAAQLQIEARETSLTIDDLLDADEAFLTNSIMATLRKKEDELARAYDEVAKREKIKSEFARTVAHELKSPMSAIMSFIEAVKVSEEGKLSAKAVEFLDRALKRGQGLNELVHDLLELAQLESAQPPRGFPFPHPPGETWC